MTAGAADPTMSRGPLTGVTVVDVSTLGPGPFASMVMADFGADVIEVRRPGPSELDGAAQFSRGKQILTIDLRAPGGAELIARLADTADVFLEGYRPGTMERRGLGPDVLMRRNPRLVYTRLTGWGQFGPYAHTAGHDISYVSIAGALGAVGAPGNVAPTVAMNLLGDFAGGSFPAVLGTVMALLARGVTGRGQVVDAAMVDGAAYLLSAQFAELARGEWPGRGKGMLSGATPFYSAYRCSDGGWVSVGSLESKFYEELLAGLGLDPALAEHQNDSAQWPRLRELIGSAFARQPRDHWAKVFSGTDGCVFPVLDLDEVPDDPHIQARGGADIGSGRVPPAPRLSETPGHASQLVEASASSQRALLAARGIRADEIEQFRASGALHVGEEDS